MRRNTTKGTIATLSASALVVLVAAGCGGPSGGPSATTPEGTVKAFLEACTRGSAGREAGYSCFTEKAREVAEKLEKGSREMGGAAGFFDDRRKLVRYGIDNVKVEGEKARIEVTTTVSREKKEETSRGVIALKREAGLWKIYGMGSPAGDLFDYEKEGEKLLQAVDMAKKQFERMPKEVREALTKALKKGAERKSPPIPGAGRGPGGSSPKLPSPPQKPK